LLFVGRTLLKLRYRVRIEGLEAILATGRKGILLLPNHPVYQDPVLLLTTLFPYLRPRILADKDNLAKPLIRRLIGRLGAIPIPDPATPGEAFRLEVARLLNDCSEGLRQGENYLLYPAGQIYLNRFDGLGDNGAVGTILAQAPDSRVVLIRITGLWDSHFSKIVGPHQDWGKFTLRELRALLADVLCRRPRRHVLIQLVETTDFPRSQGRIAMNRFMEAFYDHDVLGAHEVPCPLGESNSAPNLPESSRHQTEGNPQDIPVFIREPLPGNPAETERTDRLIGNDSVQSNNSDYWEKRKDSIYLHAVQQICRKFASRPSAVIDVGSNGTPILEWHRDGANRLVSIDLICPYTAPGVESLTQDFLNYSPDEPFDLLTCLQVLEHVEDPHAFAQRLLLTCKLIVVSVPYKWATGSCLAHRHDPVDEQKMFSWFGRTPEFSYIARELNGISRLIQVYRSDPSPSDPHAPKPIDTSNGIQIDIIKKVQASGDGCVVFSIVQNESYFMPHFFQHYRALGIDRFLIYDDSSSDGTLEFLLAQKDCTVIGSQRAFGDVCGVQSNGVPKRYVHLLKELVPTKFFPGEWVLTVDADEFVVLPPGLDSLSQLTSLLEQREQYHALAPMVDFYPETLNARNFARDISPFNACPYFDEGPLYFWESGKIAPERLWRGVRGRILNSLNRLDPRVTEQIYGYRNPKWWTKCWKIPLIKNGHGVFRVGDHEINIPPCTSLAVALAHFKFYPGLDDKIAVAISRGQYYKGSEEYRFLDAAIKQLGGQTLLSNETRKFLGADSLVAAKLL